MNLLHALIITIIVTLYLEIVKSAPNRNKRRFKRMVNGNEALPKQFPYQVGLKIHYDEPGSTWCGGTIIGRSWILTAAHCLVDETEILGVKIYLGTFDRFNSTEIGQQRIYVKKKYFIIHEDYTESDLLNDIALIRLPAPIQYDDYIKSVNLPVRNESKVEPFVGKKAITSGWGQTSEYDDDSDTEELHYISVPIISNEECKNSWQKRQHNRGSYFSAAFLCVNSTLQAPCYGDSGGPLVVQNTLVGVVSFGDGCEEGVPDIFTRVSLYINWITSKTKRYPSSIW